MDPTTPMTAAPDAQASAFPATPAPTPGGASTGADTAAVSGGLDVAAIIAEVEALARMAGVAATNSNTPRAAADVTALEREVESLLNNPTVASEASEVNAPASVDANVSATPAAPTQSIATSSLQPETIDPLLLEIDAILDDTNDSILKSGGGNLNSALNVVFDARALAGQEDEVNAALIEAFGTTRRPDAWRVSGLPTNPVPKFEGVAREVPKDVEREDFDQASVTPSLAPPSVVAPAQTFEEIGARAIAKEPVAEYAGETPFEPAFPVVAVASAVVAGASTGVESAVAATTSVTPAETKPLATTAEARPSFLERMRAFMLQSAHRVWSLLVRVSVLPLQACALPMRLLPEDAKNVVTAAALSMVLLVPVAWWLAHNSAVAPGIGRIEFPKPPEAQADASNDASASHGSAAAPAHSGH